GRGARGAAPRRAPPPRPAGHGCARRREPRGSRRPDSARAQRHGERRRAISRRRDRSAGRDAEAVTARRNATRPRRPNRCDAGHDAKPNATTNRSRAAPAWPPTLKAVAVALYLLAGWYVLASIVRFAMVGKPRKPITRGDAIASAVFVAVVVTILVIAAMRLG